MTDEQTDAAREHAEDMASKVPGLLEGLAEKIGANAGSKAVFGEPVREGQRTVIPVAQAIVGTGAGGGGNQDDAAGSGLGAGGGALTRPLGYIEVTAERADFMPLRRPWADPKLVLAYATIVLIVSRTLVKLIRG